MGLLDGTFDPRMQGLLAAGAAGLQASGPSRMPVSMGQVMGQGLMAGMGQYNEAQGMKLKAGLLDAQLKHMGMQDRLLEAQERERLAKESNLRSYADSLPPPERAKFLVDPSGYLKAMQDGGVIGKVDADKFTPESLARFATTRNYQDLVPRVQRQSVEARGTDGNPVTRFVDPFDPNLGDIQKPVRQESINVGDRFEWRSPYNPGAPLQVGMSPHQSGSLAVDRAGLDLRGRQFTFDTGQAAPGVPALPRLNAMPPQTPGSPPNGPPALPTQLPQQAPAARTPRLTAIAPALQPSALPQMQPQTPGTPPALPALSGRAAMEVAKEKALMGTRPLTEVQGKATTFSMRQADASKIIDKMEADKSFDPASIKVAMAAQTGWGSPVHNWMAGADPQKYEQARRNWVTANLRLESGAAIPPAELEQEYKKWFPVIGDSKEVIKQKTDARKVAEQALRMQAGPGASMTQQGTGGWKDL